MSSATLVLERRRSIRLRAWWVVSLITAGAFLVALAAGPLPLSFTDVLSVLGARLGLDVTVDPTAQAIVETLRLPRAVLALLVGAVLATSGAAMQGLFRNPLAEPGLVGLSAGASLAVAVTIVLGAPVLALTPDWVDPWVLPLAAFGGAFLATLFVSAVGRISGQLHVATMLLAGVAVTAIASAGIGFLVNMADDAQLRDFTYWSMGSLSGASLDRLTVAGPLMLVALVSMVRCASDLNALVLGEDGAAHLGVSVARLERRLVLSVALGVGSAVAVSGAIGFVGLVVPHLLRLTAGPDHRVLMPAAALGGAALLLLSDLVARTIAVPAEVPIGFVTSALGGPFFLHLLLRRKSVGGLA